MEAANHDHEVTIWEQGRAWALLGTVPGEVAGVVVRALPLLCFSVQIATGAHLGAKVSVSALFSGAAGGRALVEKESKNQAHQAGQDGNVILT